MDEPAPGRDAVARALVQLRSTAQRVCCAGAQAAAKRAISPGLERLRTKNVEVSDPTDPREADGAPPVHHQANGFVANRRDLSVLTSPEGFDSVGVSDT